MKKKSPEKELTYILVGTEKYAIPSIQRGLVYRIDGGFFRGVRESAKVGLITEVIADIVVEGHNLIGDKDIPETFHTKEIRRDIHDSDEFHERKSQAAYLKQTRSYWEERYTWDELVFMENFIETVYDLEGKVGDEWYRLYEIVRGELPRDFPRDVAFSIMIENVLERKLGKYTNKIMREYFKENPDAIKQILSMQVPSDLPIWPDMGFEVKHFIKYAQALADEKGLLKV